jgi:hypothetical protein
MWYCSEPFSQLSTLTDVFFYINEGASRIQYEKKFNPVWRHARKLVPFGILFSALAYADAKAGIL